MAHKHYKGSTLLEITKKYAIERHKYVNQTYDIHPYSFHLNAVYGVAKKFITPIPEEDREEVFAGCWVHDVTEDARENYNDVKKATNETIAEYAFACENPKGKTRKERNSAEYYEGLRVYKHASFIKLCDRIANMEFSKSSGGGMYKKYSKEHRDFKDHLYDGRWNPLWIYLETLLP